MTATASAKGQVPKGWRKLRLGTLRRPGDKHWTFGLKGWSPVLVQLRRIDEHDLRNAIYIRRARNARGKKK
jgi:hypothetical protein